ncbi:MAG: hypothetical protein QW775_04180 [Ignisphaera sp.]|uniref:MoaD/ThiS family protein n=1 Tax=Ignisphaera aggregans TaxID=334771 RepID=A0A7C4NKS5_9CREN
MRVFIEFAWSVAEKVGRKYLWLNLDYEELSLDDVFKKILPSILGESLGVVIYRLIQERELLVIVNGVIGDLTIKLKDGDKILIQPLASGG